ncbi:DeoR faimly transcriptional regulator [Paenibacillus sp. A3]|uniref:helix-turn-helix transcriptional regulator n=1 Tax=Paenibacillus sp. A3 TaxID=1337054 RepID=UPI0006D563A2|nr:YafY family protein [Paenibacillus sp. A3]KPV56230.1 DeoR faimly transcriptional regulator [Paenibacillus sp. A3]
MSKADNMLSILWLLKKGKRMTAQQLADELEIHVRTVYRCIDALCASGVPVVADAGHHGGYSLLESFNEAPLFFDLEEQTALVHSAAFAQQAGYPYGEALERAVAKLKRYTNEEQLHALERRESGLEVIHPPVPPRLGSILQVLEQSAAEGRTLRIAYQSGYEADVTARSIDPYGLVHWKSAWYIVAYCRLREEIRSFRVDRIRDWTHTEESFERPGGFSARQFLLKDLLPGPETQEALLTVRIQGQPQAINDLCRHWLLGHTLVERSADHVQFQVTESFAYTRLPYMLLGYGGSIFAVEPLPLKECMAGIASALAEYYETI